MRSKGDRGLAVFVMFDEEAERLAPELGLRIAHPSAALRRHIDSKTVTTRLAAEAGVPSVPNTLARVGSYAELMAARAHARGLGDDLVVQTPYGDFGRTTFFIHGERDWDKVGQGHRRRGRGQGHAPRQRQGRGHRGDASPATAPSSGRS